MKSRFTMFLLCLISFFQFAPLFSSGKILILNGPRFSGKHSIAKKFVEKHKDWVFVSLNKYGQDALKMYREIYDLVNVENVNVIVGDVIINGPKYEFIIPILGCDIVWISVRCSMATAKRRASLYVEDLIKTKSGDYAEVSFAGCLNVLCEVIEKQFYYLNKWDFISLHLYNCSLVVNTDDIGVEESVCKIESVLSELNGSI